MRAYRGAAQLAAVIWMMLPAAASAEEVVAASKVDAVTLYPAGAEVTRVTKVRIEQGEHIVIFRDLPAQAVGQSIRVEGKATAGLEIGSVDHRRTFVMRDAETDASARRRLETDLERLQDERSGLEAVIRGAELQKTFVQHLAELPTVPPVANNQAPSPDWGQLFGTIGARSIEAEQRIVETKTRLRDLGRRIEDVEKQLAQSAPKRLEQTEVKVNVSAAARLDAEIRIRYQVADAGWQPLYDARLDTGGRTAAPKLTLVRRAAIRQRTGEPWTDVSLLLSTARPQAGAAAPDLRPITIDVQLEPPRPAPVAVAPASAPVAAMRSSRLVDAEAKVTAELPAPPQQATEANTTLEAGAFATSFAIKDRTSVPETGETKNVLVEEQTLEPALVVRAVPRLDPRAYLYARITLPRTAPYLAGPVSLFRDRTFAGTGRLPLLAPGETHELGFGADDLVRVRHAVADERKGEAGIISSTRTEEKNFRLTIKNMHERAVSYAILDQVPVSLNQEIKVELLGRSAPTRRDVDDKRGVLAWEDKLNPDEERTIEFGYRTSWPANRAVVYGR